MVETNKLLADWLDDLSVRFVINLPGEELESVERICFQIEEAQWFYEDFIRPIDPRLPPMNLRNFCLKMFEHCPLLSPWSAQLCAQAYDEFLAYKTRVPVRGAVMLNEAMDRAVLVKGWKKGAKWSFPRGKINKDEKDLDCALREVYEETGFDIKSAGLVTKTSETDVLDVSMREQHLRLFVFRGVPEDTHFAPRTRKEISDIQWYPLSSLPTMKRQKQQQQGNGTDVLKDNMFYMVAPFLYQLRTWINKRRKLDRTSSNKGASLAPMLETDLEETEVEDETGHFAEMTADEPPTSAKALPSDDNLGHLLANLGRGQRRSDNLPEVSSPPEHILDPAAELKRLLSVGGIIPSGRVEAPTSSAQQGSNSLIAMLQGGSKPSTGPIPPVTPFEQVISPPREPRSPHHHHPRQPTLPQMQQPPPAFPFPPSHLQHPNQQPPFNQHEPHRGPQPQFPRGSHPPPPANFQPPRFSAHGPSLQQAFTQDAPRPYQRTGDPQFAQATQFPGLHGPAIPHASKLPPPKLTAHSLALLNSFKSGGTSGPPSQSNSAIVQAPDANKAPINQQPQSLQRAMEMLSPPIEDPFPSPQTAVMGPSPTTQTAAPKPRSAHQDTLLNLFRSPSTSAVTPPPAPRQNNLGLNPVELSAHPSPGISRQSIHKRPAVPVSNLEVVQPPRKPSITSATISGPLNAPDFETVRKQAKAGEPNGHGSTGVSPSLEPVKKPMTQISILTRQTSKPRESPRVMSPVPQTAIPVSPKTNIDVTKATGFHPQILRRPQQPVETPIVAPAQASSGYSNGTSRGAQIIPTPTSQTSFDRRETLPSDQKNTLLSLFSKPTRPTTPRMTTSGIISPVSPLPEKASQHGSPADLASRSRISSIGEGGMPPSVLGEKLLNDGVKSESTPKATGKTPVTPVDKSFLLGFLEDVTRGKR